MHQIGTAEGHQPRLEGLESDLGHARELIKDSVVERFGHELLQLHHHSSQEGNADQKQAKNPNSTFVPAVRPGIAACPLPLVIVVAWDQLYHKNVICNVHCSRY